MMKRGTPSRAITVAAVRPESCGSNHAGASALEPGSWLDAASDPMGCLFRLTPTSPAGESNGDSARTSARGTVLLNSRMLSFRPCAERTERGHRDPRITVGVAILRRARVPPPDLKIERRPLHPHHFPRTLR
jgi:hypothetical protein